MVIKEEKILTKNIVYELGLDKVSVITADMLEGYTTIGDDAFCGCTGLTSITIPNSVTNIGRYAFYNCASLTSIEIPNSITNLGMRAFSGCRSLTSVTIPNSVTSIGHEAFYNCTSLASVTIPGGVTSIELGVFYGCNSLPSVTIGGIEYKPQTVTNGKCKAYKAFNGSMKCRNFQYNEGETYEYEGEPELCTCGFHASLCLLDVFNYYWGKIDKDIVVHEVELEGVSAERRKYESKVVAKKITIGKKIL